MNEGVRSFSRVNDPAGLLSLSRDLSRDKGVPVVGLGILPPRRGGVCFTSACGFVGVVD